MAIARVTPATAPGLVPALRPMLGPEPLVQAMLTVPVAVAAVVALAKIGSYVKLMPVAVMVQFAETDAVTVKVVVAVAAITPPAAKAQAQAASSRKRSFM